MASSFQETGWAQVEEEKRTSFPPTLTVTTRSLHQIHTPDARLKESAQGGAGASAAQPAFPETLRATDISELCVSALAMHGDHLGLFTNLIPRPRQTNTATVSGEWPSSPSHPGLAKPMSVLKALKETFGGEGK
jgi:hypothetical protein